MRSTIYLFFWPAPFNIKGKKKNTRHPVWKYAIENDQF